MSFRHLAEAFSEGKVGRVYKEGETEDTEKSNGKGLNLRKLVFVYISA